MDIQTDISRKKNKLSIVINAAIIILEIIGFMISFADKGMTFIRFYTQDSNLIALVACIITVVCTVQSLHRSTAVPAWVRICKYIAVCCTTLTFLVVILILGPMMGSAHGYLFFLFGSSMLYHHFFCPVLIFISFVFLENGIILKKRHIIAAFIPTAVYAVITISLNITRTISGPYPFLRVHDQPLWMSFVWVAVILGTACLIAAVMRLLYNRAAPGTRAGG